MPIGLDGVEEAESADEVGLEEGGDLFDAVAAQREHVDGVSRSGGAVEVVAGERHLRASDDRIDERRCALEWTRPFPSTIVNHR